MNLPIVETLEDAPEKGLALLKVESTAWLPAGFPVINREVPFFVCSRGGWNTEALNSQLFDLIHAESVCKNPEWIGTEAARAHYGRKGVFVWAPTAEAAIEKYHQSEACPWGKIELHVDPGGKLLEFIENDMLLFNFSPTGIYTLRSCYHDNEVVAIHALIGEVVAFQTAEKSGSRDSRIHLELGGER